MAGAIKIVEVVFQQSLQDTIVAHKEALQDAQKRYEKLETKNDILVAEFNKFHQ